MRGFRISPNEISVSMNIENSKWLLDQLTFLAERYTLSEEYWQSQKCRTLIAAIKQSLNRQPKWLQSDE
jgi:hypothetical protein